MRLLLPLFSFSSPHSIISNCVWPLRTTVRPIRLSFHSHYLTVSRFTAPNLHRTPRPCLPLPSQLSEHPTSCDCIRDLHTHPFPTTPHVHFTRPVYWYLRLFFSSRSGQHCLTAQAAETRSTPQLPCSIIILRPPNSVLPAGLFTSKKGTYERLLYPAEPTHRIAQQTVGAHFSQQLVTCTYASTALIDRLVQR